MLLATVRILFGLENRIRLPVTERGPLITSPPAVTVPEIEALEAICNPVPPV